MSKLIVWSACSASAWLVFAGLCVIAGAFMPVLEPFTRFALGWAFCLAGITVVLMAVFGAIVTWQFAGRLWRARRYVR